MFGRIPILQQSLLVAAIFNVQIPQFLGELLVFGAFFCWFLSMFLSFSNSWSLHLQFPVHIPLFVPYPVISSCWKLHAAHGRGAACHPPSRWCWEASDGSNHQDVGILPTKYTDMRLSIEKYEHRFLHHLSHTFPQKLRCSNFCSISFFCRFSPLKSTKTEMS